MYAGHLFTVQLLRLHSNCITYGKAITVQFESLNSIRELLFATLHRKFYYRNHEDFQCIWRNGYTLVDTQEDNTFPFIVTKTNVKSSISMFSFLFEQMSQFFSSAAV